nr:echinoidin-like [Lytechinus pictus]
MLSFISLVIVLTVCSTGTQAACCCSTYWTAFGHHCYRFFAYTKSWEDAERHCQSYSVPSLGSGGTVIDSIGHLVSIHSEEEQNFVSTFFGDSAKEASSYSHMWIGLHDVATEGGYQWTDDTPMDFTKWGSTEPNDYGTGEDWAFLNSEDRYVWYDTSSATKPYFMCKLPAK